MGKIKGYYVVPHPPIIIPEIGRGEEEKAKNTISAMKKVASEIKELAPNTIIVITPHGPLIRDAIAITDLKSVKGDFAGFGHKEIFMSAEVDTEMTENIIDQSFRSGIPVVQITEKAMRGYEISGQLDHGTMVPLYYINKEYSNYKLVHITYGLLEKEDLYSFGVAVQKAVEESRGDAVVIGSGDLSHRLSKTGPYSYSPQGAIFDEKIVSLLEKVDKDSIFNLDSELIEQAGECGLRTFYILLGSMKDCNIESGEVLSYEGPYGVGYGVIRFVKNRESYSGEIGETSQRESEYVKLARESLLHYLNHNKEMKIPEWISESLKKSKRGVFVSYKKKGQLRGCIGTIYPVTENVATEIIRNSIEAGIYDPRFNSITLDELDDLEVSVDELSEPEKASKEELDPKRYGVIVSSGMKRGLLLPDLEGVETAEQQLSIALQKAGIRSEDYEIERFEVIRHR